MVLDLRGRPARARDSRRPRGGDRRHDHGFGALGHTLVVAVGIAMLMVGLIKHAIDQREPSKAP